MRRSLSDLDSRIPFETVQNLSAKRSLHSGSPGPAFHRGRREGSRGRSPADHRRDPGRRHHKSWQDRRGIDSSPGAGSSRRSLVSHAGFEAPRANRLIASPYLSDPSSLSEVDLAAVQRWRFNALTCGSGSASVNTAAVLAIAVVQSQ